jgi:hypothetical protein
MPGGVGGREPQGSPYPDWAPIHAQSSLSMPPEKVTAFSWIFRLRQKKMYAPSSSGCVQIRWRDWVRCDILAIY